MNDNYQFCREDPDAAAFKLTELEREATQLRNLLSEVSGSKYLSGVEWPEIGRFATSQGQSNWQAIAGPITIRAEVTPSTERPAVILRGAVLQEVIDLLTHTLSEITIPSRIQRGPNTVENIADALDCESRLYYAEPLADKIRAFLKAVS
jgi:hypothetical protein